MKTREDIQLVRGNIALTLKRFLFSPTFLPLQPTRPIKKFRNVSVGNGKITSSQATEMDKVSTFTKRIL